MTALIVIGIILLLFLLIALMRVGVDAGYGAEGAVVILRAGFIRITLYPGRPDAEKKRRKKIKKAKKEKKEEPDELEKGGFDKFKELMPAILDVAGRFKRKLKINVLKLHLTIAGADDPASAAIKFGSSNAAMGIIVPVLENNFNIDERDFCSDVDFTAQKTQISARAILTLAVWQIFYIAAGFIFPYLKAAKSAGPENK